MEKADTYNVGIRNHPWLRVCRPKSHIEVDEDASLAYRCAIPAKEDVVVRDVPMQDPYVVADEPLVPWRISISEIDGGIYETMRTCYRVANSE